MVKIKSAKRSLAFALAFIMALTMMTLPALAVGTTSASDFGMTVTFGDPNYPATPPESDMRFTSLGGGTYDVTSEVANFYPDVLSLYAAKTSGTVINSLTGSGVYIKVADANGNLIAEGDSITGTAANIGFYVVYPRANNATLVLTSNLGSITLNFSAPQAPPSTGTGLYAYLPAPAQFANEGVTVGGWGDAFTAGGAMKPIVNGIASTGVSLGFFGGYAVFDMGENIANSSTNPYGVDFIVYGNAFAGNSEPAGIQVAPDSNNDGVPDAWYDIAGSLHYADSTRRNAEFTYTNPYPADDLITAPGNNLGTVRTPSENNVPYTSSIVPNSGSVTYNAFHRHAWFPLYANYFTARNGVGALDKAASLPFAEYTRDTVNGSKLTLSGTYIDASTSKLKTAAYTFGYGDVHPNGSSYGEAANPYTATGTTTGGDGIDISWAVDANGAPVNLSSIRFVRAYNVAAYMNGMLGEIGAEICGVYKATGSVSGAIASPATVSFNTTTYATTPISSTQGITNITIPAIPNVPRTYTINSGGAANACINGVKMTSSSQNITVLPARGETVQYQVITQNSDGNAYVNLINITRA